QRMVRRRHVGEHREILVGAEPLAQPLRLGDPDLADLRPQRLDQLHLVAVLDHALAQLVQLLGRGLPPIRGDGLADATRGLPKPLPHPPPSPPSRARRSVWISPTVPCGFLRASARVSSVSVWASPARRISSSRALMVATERGESASWSLPRSASASSAERGSRADCRERARSRASIRSRRPSSPRSGSSSRSS